MATNPNNQDKGPLSNVNNEFNVAKMGLDLDSSDAQIDKGKLSYALNAVVENFEANSINYQNEPGNKFCLNFPEGFLLIGKYFINEQAKHIFFLVNPVTGECQIGFMTDNDCKYQIVAESPCLGFDPNFPIHKIVHRSTSCTTEIYWADNIGRRYLDLNNVPLKIESGSILCDPVYTKELDCNQLKVQPNFAIPSVKINNVITGGTLISGAYQFAVQYADAQGNPLTSYYSVTNPVPIFDPFTVSPEYNTPVGKSIVIDISNLDTTGLFSYFNLAVIKTINDIPSVDRVGIYSITGSARQLTYTGENKELVALSMQEIFEKFPYYDIADDLTTVQDILVWKGLTVVDRINYQSIATKIKLQWETWKLPADELYKEELNAVNYRGYLRDEIYSFEIVFLLANGRQTDGFHIPGREMLGSEILAPDIPDTNPDFIGTADYYEGSVGYSPYWKIYNTGAVLGTSPLYSIAPEYKGPYQYGEFAYWESEEEYPCNEDMWGDLAGKKIRHHKFPDVLVSPIFETSLYEGMSKMVIENRAVFPLGVKLDVAQINLLISNSELTPEQKEEIVGFKIIRGNRSVNKSIIAKGILRNVGEYTRGEESYFYPNYPYNDLREDPFINKVNNAFKEDCEQYSIAITALVPNIDPNGPASVAAIEFIDCNTNKKTTVIYDSIGTKYICGLTAPKFLPGKDGAMPKGEVLPTSYDLWKAWVGVSSFGVPCAGYRIAWDNAITGGPDSDFIKPTETLTMWVKIGTTPECIESCGSGGLGCGPLQKVKKVLVSKVRGDNPCKDNQPLPAFTDTKRQVFNSPETSFAQPFLGSILKLENVMYGRGHSHFVEVKNNAKYRLLSLEAQRDAFESSITIGGITGQGENFGTAAMFAAYQSYMQIYVNGLTRKNYAYSFNSIASYNYTSPILNNLGIKQRNIDLTRYLIPGMQTVGEQTPINNYNRETSVYIKTQDNLTNEVGTVIPKSGLPFPKDTPSLAGLGVEDLSRRTIGNSDSCSVPEQEKPFSVVAYYASLKNQINNQWGQIYSYSTVDTGFQVMLNNSQGETTFFGGDTFITKFAFKTKLPFFIDDRVNAPDDSEIFYDEIGNVGYPTYWHSARSLLRDANLPGTGVMTNFFSFKAHNFDCPNSQTPPSSPVLPGEPSPSTNPNRAFYDGYFYLYAYGIPNFYCETAYNLDLRQAFNNKEGEFWPHVSTAIPDDWLQEDNVTILQDNTYYYNTAFSKQNKENAFTNLPPDWDPKSCYTHFPFRAIYSDVQNTDADNRVNNWLIYRPVSYHDFPQNYGKLVSLDGVENSAILARFENKTLIYNNLLTIDTSNPQAAYIGNDKLFDSAPPIDFADTDLGFAGTQNKFLLKIPTGQVSVDTRRGHIMILNGTKIELLSKLGSGLNNFLKEHLPYKILKFFPEKRILVDNDPIIIPGINVDNHFIGVGLHGVYDSRFERVIITKLDYVPLLDTIKLDPYTQEFYVEAVPGVDSSRIVVSLKDPTYFCNKSFTLSYNLNTQSWVSFHSYIPDFYIAENNFFYSGHQECCNEFDFICGTLVPNPTTTTTTTVYIPQCTPLEATAEVIVDVCAPPLTGTVVLTDCVLAGTGVVTVPPACKRPDGLDYIELIYGYETGSGQVIGLASKNDICAVMAFIYDPSEFYERLSVNVMAFPEPLELGNVIYESNGTTDCTLLPTDGWYFTDESGVTTTVYHIVGGIIIEVALCIEPTTTTTTTTTP